MPTIEDMRNDLADRLQADFDSANAGYEARYAELFPGATAGPLDRRVAAQAAVIGDIRPNPDPGGVPPWDNDAGDRVAQVAANVWGLPITLLGQQYPVDLGPQGPDRARDVRYVMYTGDHYLGAVAEYGCLSAGSWKGLEQALAMPVPARRRRPMRGRWPGGWRCTWPRSGNCGRGSPT